MAVKKEKIITELINAIKHIMKNKEWICIQYGSGGCEYYDSTKDLDVCVYSDVITEEERSLIAQVVENLHRDFDLYIDPDISYINKTSFSMQDFKKLNEESPFPIKDGKIHIVPVEMTRDFLDSENMRLRLFINIFTVRGFLLYGNIEIYKKMMGLMYEVLVEIILRTDDKAISLKEIISILYGRNENGIGYKQYLGYNYYDKVERVFLHENLKKTISWMVTSGKVKKNKKGYILN